MHKNNQLNDGSVFIRVRTYFSLQHLQSATILCNESYKLENEYCGTFNNELSSRNVAFATNAILSSVCFLEATINELYCDAADHKERIMGLGEENISLLESMWNSGTPRTAAYSILEKYQITLKSLNMQKINEGTSPFQDIKALIQLRNSLIHFEPEWKSCLGVGQDTTDRNFIKSIQGKFKPSKFFENSGNPFFPHKCLGYGCARWATTKSKEFTDVFFNAVGLAAPYNHINFELPKT